MATPFIQSDQPADSRGRVIDELVLVVHGVGDPQPGETLSLFARSVAESQHPLTEHQEILWLEDESKERPNRDVTTFPCHTRHLSFAGTRSTLSEVYWGDMSRVQRGIPGIVSGIVSIIFGLRYVAFVAGEQAGNAAKSLQALGVICSRTLHGPVLAVNFVLAMLIVTVAVTEALWPGSSQVGRWANLLITGCVLACLAASLIGWRITFNTVCHRFWYWVMMTSLFLNGLMMWNLFRHETIPLVNYCNVMVTMLGAQWVALVLALLGMLALWGVALFEKGNYRPALHVALILPALAVGVWGQLLPVLWIGGSTSIMRFLTPRDRQADLVLDEFASRLDGVPGGVGQKDSLDRVRSEARRAARNARKDRPDRDKSAPVRFQMSRMFSQAVPLMGVQFLVSIFLGFVLIIQLVRYVVWSEKSSIERYNQGSRAPRLIVSESLQFLLATCATIVMVLVLYFSCHEFLGHSQEDDWLCGVLVESNKYAIGFIVPIAGVLALSLHYLRPGLDIILDVINHFHFRSATRDDRVQSIDEDYDIDEVTFNGGEYYFSRRDAIHRRMKGILKYYREHLPGNPTLTIVSHSQGTMIAIEVLNDEELDWINEKFRHVNMITMGSPFHHIYQKYFAHFYPPLDQPKWALLRRRVGRWLNIFRIDDFVGTHIEFPKSPATDAFFRCSNHAVERRGHLQYWSDRQVLQVIREHDICRSLPLQEHDQRRVA